MVRAPKKALKLGRALKTAARLPARVAVGNGRNGFQPLPGESPIVLLRVQVISCKDLLAKDKNGASDPFVVVSVLSKRQQTPACKRTVNPVYLPKDATFDFPIYLSLAEKLGVVEFVIWDKDVLKKDYLGEVAIPLEDWFKDNALAFDDTNNRAVTLNVVSARTSTPSSGTIQIKLGFVHPPTTAALIDFAEVYSELVKLSRPSLVSAPPTEGIGTIRSHQGGPEFEDDGLSSDDGESNTDDEEDDEFPVGLSKLYTPPSPPNSIPPSQDTSTAADSANAEGPEEPSTARPSAEFGMSRTGKPRSESPSTPTSAQSDIPAAASITVTTTITASGSTTITTPFPVKPSSSPSFTRKFLRRPQSKRSSSVDSATVASSIPTSLSSPNLTGAQTPIALSRPPSRAATPGVATITQPAGAANTRPGKARFRKSWGASKSSNTSYNFEGSNDVVGIVMLEIQGARDLPRLKNMTRTGWDMDPFVVISFGKKVFRTRVIRHSLNPKWDEKLLFHVRRYERNFKVQLAVLDWDKLTSNDHVGDASFGISELLTKAPQKDADTGLYPEDRDGTQDGMQQYQLPLQTAKEMPWEAKHRPVLSFRAKYQPYDALRQRFWRQYLKQYDTDEDGQFNRLEIMSMLDSLGSTLSRQTIDLFFTRFGKSPSEGHITTNEAIQCLETELCRPSSEKKRINLEDGLDTSAPVTPSMAGTGEPQVALNLDKLDFSGPAGNIPTHDADSISRPGAPAPQSTEPMQLPLADVAFPQRSPSSANFVRQPSTSSSSSDMDESPLGSGSSSPPSEDPFERVINVKSCPLCHRPRMNAKAEVDIVTHLAVCASQDWARVDRIVVGNFVTANQAQRKWYTKVISKVSSGQYRLGANSANIIVQNRLTGQLEEEKMQVYVRLGIRLLYKGWKGRMEGARARRLLKSLSIKQGLKYDSPESVRDIRPFIEFHRLNVHEIADPINSFKCFNDFFYRKLKPGARPVESPDDPYRLVSGADCRLMAFETVTQATNLWIKGREFSVQRLLGEAHRHEAERYNGGALCIFRLAPQDYHRFHSPVNGVVGPMTDISGEYYTVNPQAIRTALDVYGENVRKIVPIDSPQFGRVMAVCVGAMMVGSIKTTVKEGDHVKRGQEFGYFAFGGSTIVLLFEKGVVEWDEDLLINSKACLETLVRVGMGMGRSLRTAS